MIKKIILIQILICFVVIILAGCIQNNDVEKYTKTGRVKNIEYDVIFGGTFTDWRNEITFYDGTCLFTKDDDCLRKIESNKNRTGIFHFDKRSSEYDGWTYTWYDFQYVEWYENEYENLEEIRVI